MTAVERPSVYCASCYGGGCHGRYCNTCQITVHSPLPGEFIVPCDCSCRREEKARMTEFHKKARLKNKNARPT